MHILASPGYAPGTIVVNVTWMKRGFNACQMHRVLTQYPSIFNRFSVIQPVSSKVRHFSTFFAHFGLRGYAPGTIAVNVTWMERGFNAGQTLRSIYPSVFNRLWAIVRYWSEIATFFLPPLHLMPQLGMIPLDDLHDFWWVSCRMVQKYPWKVKPLSRLHTRHRRQTDRQTDGFAMPLAKHNVVTFG